MPGCRDFHNSGPLLSRSRACSQIRTEYKKNSLTMLCFGLAAKLYSMSESCFGAAQAAVGLEFTTDRLAASPPGRLGRHGPGLPGTGWPSGGLACTGSQAIHGFLSGSILGPGVKRWSDVATTKFDKCDQRSDVTASRFFSKCWNLYSSKVSWPTLSSRIRKIESACACRDHDCHAVNP